MLVIFIGPPGVGKGTQASRLSKHLNVPHVSTGEMFRHAIKDGAKLGRLASSFINQGQLVPDPLVVSIVGERVEQPDCANGCLLDGFPRTIGQARSLDAYLDTSRKSIDLVIELTAPTEELQRRLAERAMKGEGRADDNSETIPNRLKVYKDQTAPLLHYYREKNLLNTIDGLGGEEEVFQRIRRAIAPSTSE